MEQRLISELEHVGIQATARGHFRQLAQRIAAGRSSKDVICGDGITSSSRFLFYLPFPFGAFRLDCIFFQKGNSKNATD
jgi:hypothetical protein